MRLVPVLLALATLAPAADILDDEWNAILDPAGPWAFRAGAQAVPGRIDLGVNQDSERLQDKIGQRYRAEILLNVQSMPEKPGLIMGIGMAHTRWSLGTTADLYLTSLEALAGMGFPLSDDGRFRVEVLSYAGLGKSTVNDRLSTRGLEWGADLGLMVPLGRRTGLEAGFTVGYYQALINPGAIDVVVNGTTVPLDLRFDPKGTSGGLIIGWRH